MSHQVEHFLKFQKHQNLFSSRNIQAPKLVKRSNLSDEVTLSPRAILSFRSFESFRRRDHDRISFPRLGDLIGDFCRRSDGSVETDDETEDSLELDDTLDDLEDIVIIKFCRLFRVFRAIMM